MHGAMNIARRGGPPRSPQVSPAFGGGLAARSSTGLVRSSRNPIELARPGLIFLRKYIRNARWAVQIGGRPFGVLGLVSVPPQCSRYPTWKHPPAPSPTNPQPTTPKSIAATRPIARRVAYRLRFGPVRQAKNRLEP